MYFFRVQTLFAFFVLIELSVQSEFAHSFTLQGTDSKLKGWPKTSLEVKVDTTGCTVSNEALYSGVDQAFLIWNSVSDAGIKIYRSSVTNTVAVTEYLNQTDIAVQNGPVIFCATDFSTATSVDGDEVVALGYSQASSSVITLGFMILNAESGKKSEISQVNSSLFSSVLAHEMGHVLGLGHSQENSALMYYDIGSRTKLSLSKDDAEGFRYLYPRNEVTNPYPLGCARVEDRSKKSTHGEWPPRGSTGTSGVLTLIGLIFFGCIFVQKSCIVIRILK